MSHLLGRLKAYTLKTACLCAALTLALSGTPAIAFAANAEAQSTSNAEEMTQEKIDEANNAYDSAATKLTFISMSDTEFGGGEEGTDTTEASYNEKNYRLKAVADWAASHNFDVQAVLDNGDVVGANSPEMNAWNNSDKADIHVSRAGGWYCAVERSLSENFPDATMLLTSGNHDIPTLFGTVMDINHKDDEKWFYPDAETGKGNIHTKINGYDFISLDYWDYTDFLKTTLEEISSAPDYDPTKPIFIQTHSGYANTSLGGPFHANYDTANSAAPGYLQDLLKDYPQAFVGSAHTHFSVEPETSIYQKDFTFFENGSMNYIYQDGPCIDSGYFNGGQGDRTEGSLTPYEATCNFISVLEDGSTVIRRYDMTHNRWIGMPWVVDTTLGKEGFTYTDKNRSTIAPWWKNDTEVTTSNTTETSTTLGFSHAADDQLVNYYEITLTDIAGNPVNYTTKQVPYFSEGGQVSVSGSFKAYSRWYMTPNTMGFELSGLQPASYYTASIVAYDDFENASEPYTYTFRTEGSATFPELPNQPQLPEGISEGQFFNMDFENNLSDSISGVTGSANGSVSFTESFNEDSGSAVYIPAGASNYVDLGNLEKWNLGTNKNLTINFWINAEDLGGYGSFISNKNWTNWYRSGINVAPEGSNSTKIEFTLGDDVYDHGRYATGTVASYTNAWHMMSFEVDRDAHEARTYFDGNLVQATDISVIGDMTSGLNMLLGVDGGKQYGSNGFTMDNLDMWDRPLSEEEIASLYAVSDPSNSASLDVLTQAITYSQDLLKQEEINSANGRVYDEDLHAALEVAIKNATAVANESNQDLTIEQAYTELKDAVANFENQPICWSVTATAEHGVIGIEGTTNDGSYVVEQGNNVVFSLSPDKNYSLDNAQISVTAGLDYELSGSQLTVKNVSGPVNVHVVFSKQNANSGNDGGNGDNSENNSGNNGNSGNNNSNNTETNPVDTTNTNPSDNTASGPDNKSGLAQTSDFIAPLFVGATIVAGSAALIVAIAWRKLKN